MRRLAGDRHPAQPRPLVWIVAATGRTQMSHRRRHQSVDAAQVDGRKAPRTCREVGLLLIAARLADQSGIAHLQPGEVEPSAGGGSHALRLPRRKIGSFAIRLG